MTISLCILEVIGNMYIHCPPCHLLVLFPLFMPNHK